MGPAPRHPLGSSAFQLCPRSPHGFPPALSRHGHPSAFPARAAYRQRSFPLTCSRDVDRVRVEPNPRTSSCHDSSSSPNRASSPPPPYKRGPLTHRRDLFASNRLFQALAPAPTADFTAERRQVVP
ncbi:hypothetical protein U9M48_019106 [Paspalum notatum var. saurae]|uniref:Uncharacterized protein n=1 Tax=Paspalum notatum var. saurae TaxID=547442 RepID=A0AAQ3WQW7_PASNO